MVVRTIASLFLSLNLVSDKTKCNCNLPEEYPYIYRRRKQISSFGIQCTCSLNCVLSCFQQYFKFQINIQLFFKKLAFHFCRFCVVIRFFHPRHNGQWLPTSKEFLSHILSITFIFLSLFLRKSQFFPFWMFSAKQGHYWYYFYNIFGMTRSLTGDWTRE